MDVIVSKEWLLARLFDDRQVIIDCRFQLNDPEAGYKSYLQSHIPRAYYLDLEKDLSGEKAEYGGRHPLPQTHKLCETFGRLGIDDTVHVIAYDDQGGAMASRLWWLLQYVGHTRVSIMSESFTQWEAAGFPTTSEAPPISISKAFTPKLQEQMLADVDLVRQAIDDLNVLLIDSREAARYSGEQEPIDPIAGHIPSAVNFVWKDNLDENGKWLNSENLQGRFQSIDKDKEIIVYCGSGVTACPNVLALKQAGFANVKLYAGSWSDWISYEGNPIATGM